jgi:hypothetical protein
MQGKIVKKIGEQEYTFKFNINAYIAFCDLYTGEPGNFADIFSKNPFKAMRDLFFVALNNSEGGKPVNELPKGFNRELVGEWIDEMDQDDFNEIQKVALEAMTSRFKGEGGGKKK